VYTVEKLGEEYYMDFIPNFVTVDDLFKVRLPIEFDLLLLMPSEAKYHRKQILGYKLQVYNTRINKESSRSLYIEDNTNRVFFNSLPNRLAPRNIIYYLDDLIRLK
jgi:hypothetical protein